MFVCGVASVRQKIISDFPGDIVRRSGWTQRTHERGGGDPGWSLALRRGMPCCWLAGRGCFDKAVAKV